MSFTERQRLQLKAVARNPLDIRFGMINEELAKATEQLYLENSKAFLGKKDLKDRVFYHKPATLKEGEYLAYHHEFIRERGF